MNSGAIGLSSPTWGVGWHLGLHLVMRRKIKELTITRRTFPVPDRGVPDQYVQRGEMVSHEWHTKIWQSKASVDRYELNRHVLRLFDYGSAIVKVFFSGFLPNLYIFKILLLDLYIFSNNH